MTNFHLVRRAREGNTRDQFQHFLYFYIISNYKTHFCHKHLTQNKNIIILYKIRSQKRIFIKNIVKVQK